MRRHALTRQQTRAGVEQPLTLADGHVGLNSFTDESVARSNVQSRLRDIHLIEEGDPMPPGTDLGRMPVTVILKLKDGRVLSHTVRRRLGRRKIQ